MLRAQSEEWNDVGDAYLVVEDGQVETIVLVDIAAHALAGTEERLGWRTEDGGGEEGEGIEVHLDSVGKWIEELCKLNDCCIRC